MTKTKTKSQYCLFIIKNTIFPVDVPLFRRRRQNCKKISDILEIHIFGSKQISGHCLTQLFVASIKAFKTIHFT